MTIYSLKPRFQNALAPALRRLVGRGVTAHEITAAGLGVSVLCGATFVAAIDRRGLLWAVPVILLTRMALNALDGMVARQTATASVGGRVFNEIADVIGDVVAYMPIAMLLPGYGLWIATAVAGGLAAELVAIGAGEPRRNQGPFGKADRALAFSALAIALALGVEPGTWTTLVLALLAIAAGATIVNRVRNV